MIKTIKQNGQTSYGINEYIIDTKTELDLITNAQMGSQAYVINEKKTYVLNGEKEWIVKSNSENGLLFEETDPTVPEWAKQPEKPTYTPEEIGALSVFEKYFDVSTSIYEYITGPSYPFNNFEYRGKNIKGFIYNIGSGEYLMFENLYSKGSGIDLQKISYFRDAASSQNPMIFLAIGKTGEDMTLVTKFDYEKVNKKIKNIETTLNGLEDLLAGI